MQPGYVKWRIIAKNPDVDNEIKCNHVCLFYSNQTLYQSELSIGNVHLVFKRLLM